MANEPFDNDTLYDTDAPTVADPVHVARLVKGMAVGIQTAIVPNQTTDADILSAVLTVLYRILAKAKESDDPMLDEKNALEVGKVLQDMLFTFGAPTQVH